MNYGTLNGILTTEKTFRGNISQPLAILINEALAREIIEARGNEKSLPDRLNTFVTYTYANLHYNVGKTTKEGGEVFNDYTNNKALSEYTHAEGQKTRATKPASHSEGYNTEANGSASHSEGTNCVSKGVASHAEGDSSNSEGDASHAEGCKTNSKGVYSHSEGQDTIASGVASHTEGNNTQAKGHYSHSEGLSVIAKGIASHAEGQNTEAEGDLSHTEGYLAKALGYISHAEGFGTIALAAFSHAQGKFNVIDSTKAHIVGNGLDDNNRSNAYTLDWDGNGWFAGTVEATSVILRSITPNSKKKFKIVVDDSGTISATEYQ